MSEVKILSLIGIAMLPGKQSIPASGPAGLTRGQSVTDACISWETTLIALERLREGVRARRSIHGSSKGAANGVKAANGAAQSVHDHLLASKDQNGKGFNDDALFTLSKNKSTYA